METKNTLEIELWSVREEGGNYWVEYSIYEGESESNVSQQIETKTILEFIKKVGYNAVCTDLLKGIYEEFDPKETLDEATYMIVKDFLLDNLK